MNRASAARLATLILTCLLGAMTATAQPAPPPLPGARPQPPALPNSAPPPLPQSQPGGQSGDDWGSAPQSGGDWGGGQPPGGNWGSNQQQPRGGWGGNQQPSGGWGGGQQPGGGWGRPQQPGGQNPNAQLDQLARFETQDFGVPASTSLHSGPMHGRTPASIPGGRLITTKNLAAMVQQQSPYLVLDVLGSGETLPGALAAAQASQGGHFSDQVQQQFGQFLQQATRGNKQIPLIVYCQSVECWMSYNAALRAINLGYSKVLWYRGGIAAWKQAGFPTMPAGGGMQGGQGRNGGGYPNPRGYQGGGGYPNNGGYPGNSGYPNNGGYNSNNGAYPGARPQGGY